MSAGRFKPLFDRDFLKASLHYEFLDYCSGDADAELLARLQAWSDRELQRETQAENSFVQRFFVETWAIPPTERGRRIFSSTRDSR